ncbi:MAG TPA: hypothetical protein DEB31_11730, partial [Clostridiales bacterium]|nr:hypothetical protein [Clostridiales bacterium]
GDMDAAEIEAILAGESPETEPEILAETVVDNETEQLAAELEAMLSGESAQDEPAEESAAAPSADFDAVPEQAVLVVLCEACGTENTAEDLFCKACGNPMGSEAGAQPEPDIATGTNVVVCEQCGTNNRQGDLFCEECGSQLPSVG